MSVHSFLRGTNGWTVLKQGAILRLRLNDAGVTQLVEYLNDSQVAAGSSPATITEGKQMVSGRFGTAVL